MRLLFWLSGTLLVHAQAGYGLLLALLLRGSERGTGLVPGSLAAAREADLPSVAVIVAAYAEEAVIAGRVANLLELDYPRERFTVVVACDGSPDRTAERAREAGADLVLELPRGGKIRAQDAAVAATEGALVAFGDANATWEPGALRALAGAFLADSRVGYACGDVRFVRTGGGDNQEGLYWRYEMWLRRMESSLRSVTAGNGAIYALRREAYLVVDPIMGHDLSLPFNVVKRGRRAVYVSEARASEPMVPTIDGEFARKRRMMSHTWPIVLRGGMLSPRGYDPLYALMIFSHRVLRYLTPFLHAGLALATLGLLPRGRTYRLAATLQAALAAGAAAAGTPLERRLPAPVGRVLRVARYYLLTTASPAAGLYDWLRHGTSAGWEPAPGTR